MKKLNKDQIKNAIKSGEITGFVLREIKKIVAPGITTLEMDKIATRIITSRDSLPAFLGIDGYKYATCISVNDEVVHGVPSGRVLEEGDIVSLDVGTNYKGMNTDATATYVVGKFKSEDTKRLFFGTREALYEAIKIVKADVYLGDIEEKIGETLKKYGLSPVMSLSGHGIGEKVHQEPSIMCDGKAGTGPKIPEKVMLAIEPMATLGNGRVKASKDGWNVKSVDSTLGAHFEHTVLVEKNRAKILTQYE